MSIHRYRPQDVEIAFDRYKDLTGDRTARLKRIGTTNIAIYVVEDSQHLDGFRAYGARAAYDELDLFNRGFAAGRELAGYEEQKA